MIGTILSLAKTLPHLISGVQAVAPKNVSSALQKVKNTAVVGGGLVTATQATLAPENQVQAFIALLLSDAGVPLRYIDPASSVSASVALFIASTISMYIVGWTTQERNESIWKVKAK